MAENKNKIEQEIEQAKKELEEKKAKLREVKDKYTMRGARKKINMAYKELLGDEEMNESQKIEAFFNKIAEIKKEYTEE